MSPERIGPYRLAEKLGSGGMGSVYRAFDERLDRWVAIKQISPEVQASDQHRERLRREARAAAKLSHPSIVQVFDIVPLGKGDCIVMELVEGRSLADLVQSQGPLPWQEVVRLGLQVAAGLLEAHGKGIIHRDLKAENIVVTPAGQAKILDFGIAKRLHSERRPDLTLTQDGMVVGTVRAMSPEHASGEPVDHRSDLFSLGSLLYEAITGESPFQGDNDLATLKKVIMDPHLPVTDLRSEVPHRLALLIDRLLAKRPEQRPQNASEVLQALSMIAHEAGLPRTDTVLAYGGDSSAQASTAGGIHSGTPTDVIAPHSMSGPQAIPGASGEHSVRPTGWGAGSIDSSTHPIPIVRPQASAALRLRRLVGRPWSVGVLVALVLVAALAGWWTLERLGDGADTSFFQARDWIVLGDFENRTGEDILDDSLDIAFRVGLEQSRYANVLPEGQMRLALRRMNLEEGSRVERSLGTEICLRESAKALVLGSIVKVAETYSLTATVINPGTGQSVSSMAEEAEGAGKILRAMDRLTSRIRASLGESLASIRGSSESLERVTTKDLEALKAYSLGVTRVGEGRTGEAISLFERAVERDPDFAMAHARLAAFYWFLDNERAKAPEHFAKAIALANRLPESERLYIEGVYTVATGTPSEMVRRWSLMASIFPDEHAGHHNLGMSHWVFTNNYRDGLAALERAAAIKQNPLWTVSLHNGAFCKLGLGRLDEAVTDFESAFAESGGDPLASGLADGYVAVGQHPKAEEFLDESMNHKAPYQQMQARLKRISMLTDQGLFQRALAAGDDALSRAESLEQPRAKLWSLASLTALEERAGSRADFEAALDRSLAETNALLDAGRERIGITVLPHLALLGKVAARNGLLDRARAAEARIADKAAESGFPFWEAYASMLRAELALAEGRPEDAVRLAREAIAVNDPFQARESLARALESAGDVPAAEAALEWLIANRGRALSECLEECLAREHSLIDWAAAHLHLGRLAEADGRTEEAARRYRDLLEHWKKADPDLPLIAEARRRLANLDAAT